MLFLHNFYIVGYEPEIHMVTKINPANLQPLQEPLFTVEHDCQQPTERWWSCTRMVGLCLHHSLPLKGYLEIQEKNLKLVKLQGCCIQGGEHMLICRVFLVNNIIFYDNF